MRIWQLSLYGIAAAGISTAAAADIPAGTTETGGSVSRGDVQNVFGTAVDFAVHGTQNIMSGGESQNSEIYSYGRQVVEAGGISVKTQVFNNAIQTVGGRAEQTLINYGKQEVEAGGLALNSTLRNGILNVKSGGTAQGASLQRGTETVYGTDIDAVIGSRGTQEIKSGGTAEGTKINSGGTAEGTKINSGGSQYVETGGISRGAVIDGGYQLVEGTAENSVMYDGSQIVDGGRLSEGTVNGGGLSFSSGGRGENIVLNDGGVIAFENSFLAGMTVNGGNLLVSGGAEISDLSQTGGSTLLEEGSVVSGTTRLTGGELKVQGAAEIPDLELAGTRVDLVADNQYSKLTIGRLNGEGNFYLNSEVAASHSDELEVQNGHGSFGIAMTDRSYEEVFPDKVHIVQDNGGDAEFHLLGGAVDIGAYRYDLHHEGGEWVLERTSQSTDTAVLSRNAYSAVNSVFVAQMETMNNRFDELHYYRDNGLWIKGGLREMKLHFKDASRSRVNTTTTQIGYDFKLPQQKFDYWLAGVTAGFTDSRQKFDRSGRADGDTMSLGIYSSLMTRNKYFVDVTANYYWHDQKLKSYLPHGADVDGKYKVNGWSLAAETGKRWRLDGGWFAEPHLKMKYISLGNMEHRTSHNTRIKGRGATSLEGRLGASAGYVWDRSEVFVELNLVEEFNGRSKIDVAGVTMKEDISDTMYEIGAGMKFQPAEHLSSYVKVSTLLGDKVEIPVDFNLGVRYEF